MSNQLALCSATPIEEDLVILAMNKLGNECKEVFGVIHNQGTPISYEELHDQLADNEEFLKSNTTHLEPIPIIANLTQNPKLNSQG